jgi:C-terminal processing protease CtpA/Prc
MFIGTFDSPDLSQFPADVAAAFDQFKASGVKNILIDVTNNPGPCTFFNKGDDV